MTKALFYSFSFVSFRYILNVMTIVGWQLKKEKKNKNKWMSSTILQIIYWLLWFSTISKCSERFDDNDIFYTENLFHSCSFFFYIIIFSINIGNLIKISIRFTICQCDGSGELVVWLWVLRRVVVLARIFKNRNT